MYKNPEMSKSGLDFWPIFGVFGLFDAVGLEQ
jgi:hypothetical protein